MPNLTTLNREDVVQALYNSGMDCDDVMKVSFDKLLSYVGGHRAVYTVSYPSPNTDGLERGRVILEPYCTHTGDIALRAEFLC